MVFGINIGRRPGPEDIGSGAGSDFEPVEISEKMGNESGWIRQGKVIKVSHSDQNGLVEAEMWGAVVWDNKPMGNKESAGYPHVTMTGEEAENFSVGTAFPELRVTEYRDAESDKKICTPKAYSVLIENSADRN